MTRFDFQDLEPGQERHGAVCVRRREDRRSRKSGSPFAKFEFGNQTGSAAAAVWEDGLPQWSGVTEGDAIEIAAVVKPGWNGGPPELEVVSMKPLPSTHPVRLELNPEGPLSREELEEEFDALRAAIRRERLRDFLDMVICHVGRDEFFSCPAALYHHHAVLGGLASHSIEVGKISLSLAAATPAADRVDSDHLIVASLIHDLGKIDVYEWQGTPIRISHVGRLSSHVTRGVRLIRTVAEKFGCSVLVEDEIEHLEHLVESHHGQLEWGSPVEPVSLEAQILHLADLASSRIRGFLDDMESATADPDSWIDSARSRRTVFDWRSVMEAIAGGGLPVLKWGFHRKAQTPEERLEIRIDEAPASLLENTPETWDLRCYLAFLVGQDLTGWKPDRGSHLKREDAEKFFSRLAKSLPPPVQDKLRDALAA